jgi:hypothetical protein
MTGEPGSEAIDRLESEMSDLKRKIEQNPDEDAMLNLARKMSEDRETVREAVRYAEIPEKDRKKLLELVEEL